MSKKTEKELKKRTLAQKHGRLKWLEILLRRVIRRMNRIEKRQRIILKGLEHYFEFPADYIEDVAAESALEKEILQVLRENPGGVLPCEIAEKLTDLGTNRWQVTRRIRAMNKRMQRELGKDMAHKSGHKWMLSAFMAENWGEQLEATN